MRHFRTTRIPPQCCRSDPQKEPALAKRSHQSMVRKNGFMFGSQHNTWRKFQLRWTELVVAIQTLDRLLVRRRCYLLPSARMRSESIYCSWVCVCVCVTLHPTSPMFFRLTNDTTYLTGNEGQNFEWFSLKMLRCKARALPALYIG